MRAALLVRATGAPDLLFEATEDRLHQPYRATSMPETSRLIACLRDMGITAVASGARPTVLARAPGRRAAARTTRAAVPASTIPAAQAAPAIQFLIGDVPS